VTVGAVLLAAGGGSRFAGESHKLLAVLRGRPVVSWSLDAVLAAGFDRVAVVTGAVDLDHLVPAGVELLPNPRWAEGQATSLARGIEWARAANLDAVAVGLGDQPGVTSAGWRAVAAVSGSIAVATYGGRRGNPVRLAADIWPLLPSAGDEGARVVMRSRPDLVVEVACEGDPADVDTLEDLDRWS
jgi:CTP:molybdopterin cytidylyltransferase MocA